MAPVEIRIPSFRFSKKENEEELRTNLDLIEELREQAQVWGKDSFPWFPQKSLYQ